MSLPPNKVMVVSVMLWHGFHVLITEHMAQILHYYDVCLTQLPPINVLAHERDKFFQNIISVKVDYDEIMSVIEFIEDHGHLFLVSKTFYCEKVNLFFTVRLWHFPNGMRILI